MQPIWPVPSRAYLMLKSTTWDIIRFACLESRCILLAHASLGHGCQHEMSMPDRPWVWHHVPMVFDSYATGASMTMYPFIISGS